MPSRKRNRPPASSTGAKQVGDGAISGSSEVSRSSTSSSIVETSRHKEEVILNLIWDSLSFSVRYVLDLLKQAILLAKRPLSLVLVLYVCYWLLLRTVETVVPALLTSICQLPLMPLVIPICEDIRPKPAPQPDFPNLIGIQNKLEKILDESSTGTTVALELKKSELAVRDLTSLVRASSLTSKELLEKHLLSFVTSAKDAGRRLQGLGSRIGGTVDSILAMDDYVLHLLEKANEVPTLSFFSAAVNILVPMRPSPVQQALAKRKEVEDLWFQAAAVVESSVKRLVDESEASVVLLNSLEESLVVLHEMIARETDAVEEKTDELLADLWTRLGGNRRQLANFKSNRALLANVRVYRNRALRYVASTLVQLQQLSSDLEELRDRVVVPLLSDPESNIPLEVHIGSVRNGIERLTQGRIHAKEREDAYLRKILDSDSIAAIGDAA